MFLIEPDRTPLDLNFRLFGIGVRVHPLFWLVSALLSPYAMKLSAEDLPLLLVWIACVFVSILIHEMGHVLVGRFFGARGHIILYGMGGLAVGSSALAKRWQRVAVYLAGPLAQFVLFGATFALLLAARQGEWLVGRPAVREAILALLWINLAWPLLNLLPIWPLDGGRISREIFESVLPDKGARIALGFSMFVAGLLAIHSLMTAYGKSLIPAHEFGIWWVALLLSMVSGGTWMALFFAMFALNNFQELQQIESQRRWRDDHWNDWER